MCGRYVARVEAALERDWQLVRSVPPFVSYNVAPTQRVPIVRQRPEGRVLELLRWGLIPFFARGVAPAYSTINARVETVRTAASYRGPWKRGQRCLVVASGFYEWQVQADGKSKIPYYIHLKNEPVFAFAGLWDSSVAEDGTAVESCVHITLEANRLVGEIHNAKRRMPAILASGDLDVWLRGSADAAFALLRPYPDELMAAWPVSKRVNSPKNDDASLIEPQA